MSEMQRITSLANRIKALEGNPGSAPTSMPEMALEFTGEGIITRNSTIGAGQGHNVNHGRIYNEGDGEEEFVWGAWIYPYGQAEGGYILSESATGGHRILFGTVGEGQIYLTGNIYPGSGDINDATFASMDAMRANSWHYVAVTWDGAAFWVYMDGVVSQKKAYAGARGYGNGFMYVGGSDHNNYKGLVRQIEGFEGNFGYLGASRPNIFRPNLNLAANEIADTLADPNFLWDYTKPSWIIPNLGTGLDGRMGNGVRSVGALGTTDQNAPEEYLPQWVETTFEQTPYDGTITPTPVGALLFDAFERTDRNQIWQNSVDLTLGVAPTGQTWSCSVSTGIINTAATTMDGSGETVCDASVGQSDMDVTITRNTAGANPTLILRYVNASNFISAVTVGTDLYLSKKVAGVDTAIDFETLVPANWSTIRVKVVGNNYTVYTDGVSRLTATDAALNTATRAGFIAPILSRVENITVIPGV